MPDVELILGLVVVGCALAALAQAASLPYQVVLVLGGLAIGLVPGLPTPRLEPDVVFLVFLPPLVYSEALRAATANLAANARPIGLLATGLVLATVLGVAWVAHAVTGLQWGSAFVLGAVLGPTDPIAATSIFRRLGAPDRMSTILEGESLINDGTGLTVYKLAVAAVVSGSFALGDAVVRFVLVAAGGVAVGLLTGWLSIEIRRRIREPTIEASFSLLTAFLAYLPAERLGASGILAAVAAGLYVGRRAGRSLSAASRLQTLAFWDVVTFLLQSLLFLLIGLQLPSVLQRVHSSALPAAGEVVAVVGVLLAVRLMWMFGVSGAVRLLDADEGAAERRLSRREQLVLGLTGMRGAVSLAAATAVPLTADGRGRFPNRDEVLFLTYGTVLVTLVAPGLALPKLLRVLGLAQDEARRREELSVRAQLARAALARLRQAAEREDVPESILDELRAGYEERIARAERELEPQPRDQGADWEARVRLAREALAAERARLGELRRNGQVSNKTVRRLLRELDIEEMRLTTGRPVPGVAG